MADTKGSALTTATPVVTDTVIGVDDPGGTPSSKVFLLSAIKTLFASDLSAVATTGDYDDLTGKPTLGTAAATDATAYATSTQGAKADAALVKANGIGVVEHGATAETARPTGYAIVAWIGSVPPNNAAANDLYYPTA